MKCGTGPWNAMSSFHICRERERVPNFTVMMSLRIHDSGNDGPRFANLTTQEVANGRLRFSRDCTGLNAMPTCLPSLRRPRRVCVCVPVCVFARACMYAHTLAYRLWREMGKEVVFESLCFAQAYQVDTSHAKCVLKNILVCVIQHKTLLTVLSSNIFLKIDFRRSENSLAKKNYHSRSLSP